jgi:hypothetical protein
MDSDTSMTSMDSISWSKSATSLFAAFIISFPPPIDFSLHSWCRHHSLHMNMIRSMTYFPMSSTHSSPRFQTASWTLILPSLQSIRFPEARTPHCSMSHYSWPFPSLPLESWKYYHTVNKGF